MDKTVQTVWYENSNKHIWTRPVFFSAYGYLLLYYVTTMLLHFCWEEYFVSTLTCKVESDLLRLNDWYFIYNFNMYEDIMEYFVSFHLKNWCQFLVNCWISTVVRNDVLTMFVKSSCLSVNTASPSKRYLKYFIAIGLKQDSVKGA